MQQATVLDEGLGARAVAGHQAASISDPPADRAGTPELLKRASVGDQVAWDRLVDRHAGLVWAVARAYGLRPGEAGVVSQVTWLRAAQQLGSLARLDRLGIWLATTARRESVRMLRLRGLEAPVVDGSDLEQRQRRAPAAAAGPLAAEGEVRLWRALESLPGHCRPLLRLLVADPPLSDAEIAAALGLPVGRVGPARAWCLDCLRRRLPRAMGAAR